jgi:UDP-N-acetylglucosamine transferase subunit ALG13
MTFFSAPDVGTGMFLSTSGGHFPELLYLTRRFKANKDSLVITYETPDTEINSPEFEMKFFPYVKPRRIIPLLKMLRAIFALANARDFDYIASTGAGIAIVGYLVARMKRLPFYYVEIIARQSSLSLSARMLKILGQKYIFVQSETISSKFNVYLNPPINNFEVVRQKSSKSLRDLKIFIALGTIKGFNFERAIKIVLPLLKDSDSVHWQTGYSVNKDLPGKSFLHLNRELFLDLLTDADVIICHGGIGIIGECLSAGKVPLVIPRRKMYSEHIDDHQVEIVSFLLEKDLIISLEGNENRDIFQRVLERSVKTRDVY